MIFNSSELSNSHKWFETSSFGLASHGKKRRKTNKIKKWIEWFCNTSLDLCFDQRKWKPKFHINNVNRFIQLHILIFSVIFVLKCLFWWSFENTYGILVWVFQYKDEIRYRSVSPIWRAFQLYGYTLSFGSIGFIPKVRMLSQRSGWTILGIWDDNISSFGSPGYDFVVTLISCPAHCWRNNRWNTCNLWQESWHSTVNGSKVSYRRSA